jgi:hypothetical protein
LSRYIDRLLFTQCEEGWGNAGEKVMDGSKPVPFTTEVARSRCSDGG